MAPPASKSTRPRTACAFLTALTLSGLLFPSCQHEEQPAPAPAATPPQAEVDEAKLKLGDLEASLTAKNDELAKAKTALEAVRTQLAERDLVFAQKDTQIRNVQAEMEAMKKREAFVFEEISTLQQQGQTVNALHRYQQFLKDFPKSPLAVHATNAVSELSVTAELETRPRPNMSDPKVREREFVQQFEEGFLTLKELAPVLKKRSISQVLALLGPPNRIFGDGTEIGYVDKAIDPVTSKRGMFIIAFDSGAVANLRVEYAGRRMVP